MAKNKISLHSELGLAEVKLLSLVGERWNIGKFQNTLIVF